MPVSKEQFRRVMAQLATGVTVVTSRRGDDLHGMTANAVTSVSLEPLLVLVCVDHAAESYGILKERGVFAVNILSQEQEELSRRFAAKEREGTHHLEGVAHRFAVTGAPIIEGCLAYLDCRVVAIYPGGDHSIFLGQVEDAGIGGDDAPLVFFRGQYRRLA